MTSYTGLFGLSAVLGVVGFLLTLKLRAPPVERPLTTSP